MPFDRYNITNPWQWQSNSFNNFLSLQHPESTIWSSFSLTAVLLKLFSTGAPTKSKTSGNAAYTTHINYVGCFTNQIDHTLLGKQVNPGNENSPTICGTMCGLLGYKYGGLRSASQCWCGNSISRSAKEDDSGCTAVCPGNSSATCGGPWSTSIYEIANPKPAPTNGFVAACSISPLSDNKVCDKSLSIAERVAGLVSSMNLDQKAGNLVNAASGALNLGLMPYEWWSEALHGVADSPGVSFTSPNGSEWSYSTSFPMPILLGAAFDDPLVNAVASVIGKEGRAFANHGHSGLDFWTPNINPFRDPRWGRGLETPGEDSYRMQKYVQSLIPGLQGSDPAHKQVIATCKHYAAYDVEQDRSSRNYNPSQQDMAEYFLPPFKTCVRDVDVASIMCAYNSVDGVPACASEYILNDVLRKNWDFNAPYQYVVSDCEAIQIIYDAHGFVDNSTAAAAVALNAGTDLDCGSAYLMLADAVRANYTTETAVDKSLTRLYTALFTLGYFDGDSPYTSLAWSDISTPSAQSLAYTAAVEGITMLKNDVTLPINKNVQTVAVIGPWANATEQMQGNYAGIAPYLNSPLSAFQSKWDVNYAFGTDMDSNSTSGFNAAITAAKASDLVIYLGGIDTSVEEENVDRTSISWPGNQLDLISELTDTGKPVIVIQFGGGQVDDTELVTNKGVKAILWAGYPGQDGGYAILDILTGTKAPAGRLPLTQYLSSYADEISIYDISLRPSSSSPGRTYKWYTGTPVFPYGYGLHYTTFSYSWDSLPQDSYDIESLVQPAQGYKDISSFFTVTATIKNTGQMVSDYVGLLFITTKNGGPAPYPNKSLVSYARLHDIPVGSALELSLPITLGSLARADDNGDLTIYPGDYTLTLDVDAKLTYKFELTGRKTIIETLPRPASKYNYTVPVYPQP